MSFLPKTPLIKFKEIGKELKVDVYGKIETVNPTGSHKDRESLQVISDLRKGGYRRFPYRLIIDLTDQEIREATALLLKEGVIAEPASAASIAALNHIDLEKKDVVCCTITGSGMKFPKTMQKALS